MIIYVCDRCGNQRQERPLIPPVMIFGRYTQSTGPKLCQECFMELQTIVNRWLQGSTIAQVADGIAADALVEEDFRPA